MLSDQRQYTIQMHTSAATSKNMFTDKLNASQTRSAPTGAAGFCAGLSLGFMRPWVRQ